jgi:hypothetical protein
MTEDVRRFYEVRKQDRRCLQAVEVRTERERALVVEGRRGALRMWHGGANT